MVEKKFWLVWCVDGAPPAYQHPTEESAKTEANRLAGQNPGRMFVVLEATHAITYQAVVSRELHEGATNEEFAVKAIRKALEAMKMQEQRETGLFHVAQPTAKFIWDEAKADLIDAIDRLEDVPF